jgi:S-adenosylmethionine-diacylgycerolhomoserine-N-methlytransferase
MIPPWRAALRQALGALKPGGRLHIVDFGAQAGLPRWFSSGLNAWLAGFSVEPRSELQAELAALAARPGYEVRSEQLYRGYAVYAVVTRVAAA